MTGLAVIDGDIISFRCSAANEKRTVEAVHKETLESSTFDTATAFKAWVASDGNYSVDDFNLTPKQTAGPIEHAIGTLKQLVHKLTKEAKCSNYHIVLSGKENFRLDLPLPTRYKDSRKELARPLQLQECRDYLIKYHNAEVSEGCEADDLMAGYCVNGYNNDEYVVQVNLDKDSLHGPGWVYDWTKMTEPELITGYGGLTLTLRDTGKKSAKGEPVMEKIVKGKGRAFLVYQILFGDPVDSYKPCELAKVKFGEVGAYELLKNATTDKEAWEVVVGQYRRWYPEELTYRAWDNSLHTKSWLDILQMYADCAFMRRWEGDSLDVRKLLTKLGIEHSS